MAGELRQPPVPTSMKAVEGTAKFVGDVGSGIGRAISGGARALGEGLANTVRDEIQITAVTALDASGIRGYQDTRDRAHEVQRERHKGRGERWLSPVQRGGEALTRGVAGLLSGATDYLAPNSRSYDRMRREYSWENFNPAARVAQIGLDLATNIPLIGAAIGAVDVPTAVLSKHVLNNFTVFVAHNLSVMGQHMQGR